MSDPNEHGTAEHPFDSVDEALAAAVHGDVIQVMPGYYFGPQNTDMSFRQKRVALRSAAGPTSCVVDMQGQGRGAYASSAGSDNTGTVDGFTFVNGFAAGGGALRFENGAAPTIANCVFLDNTEEAEGGGAVYGIGGSPYFVNCLFVGNASYKPNASAKGVGGAALLTSGFAWFDHCTFYGNYAETAGGAVATRGAFEVVTNSIAWGNESPDGAQLAGALRRGHVGGSVRRRRRRSRSVPRHRIAPVLDGRKHRR